MNFWNMSITIIDVIIITLTTLGIVVSYIRLYSNVMWLKTRVELLESRLESRINLVEKQIGVSNEKSEEMIGRFNKLETSQVKTNTLLEENLNHLIKIVDRHDLDIEALKNLIRHK